MRRLVAVLAVTTALAGCSSSGQTRSEVTVFAAASLTETFTRIGQEFEAANPGTDVRFNFGASSALAQQIGAGAPADVFAAASPATMQQVGARANQPVTFARNRLTIAVAKGNPLRITGLADITRPGVKLALCAEQVPCGAAARAALRAARLSASPVTLEQDVKATLTKVRLGEVDAALVYRTDVGGVVAQSDNAVEGVDFPEAALAVNDYPIATLTEAPNAAGARSFVDHVRSDKGRQVLAQAGFETP